MIKYFKTFEEVDHSLRLYAQILYNMYYLIFANL